MTFPIMPCAGPSSVLMCVQNIVAYAMLVILPNLSAFDFFLCMYVFIDSLPRGED